MKDGEIIGRIEDFDNKEFIASNFNTLKREITLFINENIKQMEASGSKKESKKLSQSKLEYYLDLRHLFHVLPYINKSKFAEYLEINPSLFRQYTIKPTYISEERLEVINKGLHRAAKDMLDVVLVP